MSDKHVKHVKRSTVPFDREGLVKEHVLLPILLDVLKYDRHCLSRGTAVKFPKIYVKLIDNIANKVREELAAINRRMRDEKIRVFEVERTEKRLEVRYTVENYEYTEMYRWEFVRAELERRLMRILQR